MELKTILSRKENEVALIIGNGINRYGNRGNSWEGLLKDLLEIYKPGSEFHTSGLSLTELYDVLELVTSEKSLQQQFCDLLSSWTPGDHHKRIVNWASKNSTPILTTNFESTLSDCRNLKAMRTVKGKFTAFYPWETYFGNAPITNPSKSFGVWHINGTQKYRQSIRLGLSHYMGSVHRARTWLYRGGKKRLFSGKSHNSWRGSKSWLQIIFDSDLVIFGLGLNEQEVFLRWLLIERARCYGKFPNKMRNAWYIQDKPVTDMGKKFFLDGIGIKTIVISRNDIYGPDTWE